MSSSSARSCILAPPAPALANNDRDDFEFSIHSVPHGSKSYVSDVLPNVQLERLLIVPTCQKASVDLVGCGEHVENEKDRLLNRFLEWAAAVQQKLASAGHWADYCDPCSGLCMIDKSKNRIYDEVSMLSTLLGYSLSTAGGCRVVSHIRWGTSVYPSTLFTTASQEELQKAIREISEKVERCTIWVKLKAILLLIHCKEIARIRYSLHSS